MTPVEASLFSLNPGAGALLDGGANLPVDHLRSVFLQLAAPGPGDGPPLVRLNSLVFHAEEFYIFDTWLLPKDSGPAALPGVPQHGLVRNWLGSLTVASSMTDAWIIRRFKRSSLLSHSRIYLRRVLRSRIRTAKRRSLAA